jgi:hypothetical protein
MTNEMTDEIRYNEPNYDDAYYECFNNFYHVMKREIDTFTDLFTPKPQLSEEQQADLITHIWNTTFLPSLIDFWEYKNARPFLKNFMPWSYIWSIDCHKIKNNKVFIEILKEDYRENLLAVFARYDIYTDFKECGIEVDEWDMEYKIKII